MNCCRSIVTAALLVFCFSLPGQDETPFPETKWEAPATVKARLSSPALDEENGLLYAGGSNGRLYAFDIADGTSIYDPGIRVGIGQCSAPLIGPDGTVYVGVIDGSLVAVTNMAENPGVKWRYRAAAGMVGSPAMDSNGVIYIGSRDNRLHAVHSAHGARNWTFDAGVDVTSSPMVTPNGDIVFVAGGAVFTVSSDGAELSLFRAGIAVRSLPVVAEDDTIYFGANNGFIYAVNGSSDGSNSTSGLVWRIPAGADVQSKPALGAGGSLYIGTDNRRVLSLDADGGVIWRFPAEGRTRGPVRGGISIGADGTIYVGTDVHTLYAITPDGQEKWKFDSFKGQVRGSPVIDSEGTVYFTAGRSVHAVLDDVFAEESPWPQFRRDAQHSATSTAGEPFISKHPESVTATNGQTVEFTVVASAGAPVSYQWSFNGEDIDPEENSTATNATLVIENVTPADAGIYEVFVFNDFGEAFSDPAELFVESAPQIVSDLTNRFVSIGSIVRLQVDAVGLGQLTYQWHSNGVNIAGATNSFFAITNAQISDSALYDVIVRNVFGPTQSRTSMVTVVSLTLTRSTNNVIAAGNRFSAAVISNQLFAWGADVNGQLADGGTTNRNIPTRTSTNTDWLSVSAGGRGNTNASGHALALRNDGSLYAWGANSRGQLGIGSSTNDQRTPVRVGSDTNWAQIEAGATHSIALRLNGTIWAWGGDDFGQLGIGGSNNTVFPTQVGLDTGWVEVRSGGSFSLARRADGTIWGWGRNDSGQIGNNSTNVVRSPVQIGTGTNWIAISAGASHSLGLRSDGTLWTWGRRFGLTSLLIDRATNVFRVPTQVGSESNWVAIEAGYDHSLAINNQGRLFSFGANNIGQLGNGISGPPTSSTNTANLALPTEIGAGRAWSAIDAGVKHSLARATDGTVWAWGWNNFGQVGDGTGGDGTDNANVKAPVQLTFTNFTSVNTNVPSSTGPPVFTRQPASTNVAPFGEVTFSAEVSGATPMTNLWYFNRTNALPNSTNLIYMINNVQVSHAGEYSVVVSNSAGWTTSAVAMLTTTNAVIAPPSFPSPAAKLGLPDRNTTAARLLAPVLRTNGISIPLVDSGDAVWILEFRDRLTETNWTPLSTNVGTASLTNLFDPAVGRSSRFYRVRQQ